MKGRVKRFFYVSIVMALFVVSGVGQQPKDSKRTPASQEEKKQDKKKRDNSKTEVDLTQLRLMLDQLVDQARSLEERKGRPQIIAEVADAYWYLDEERASNLFTTAMETALSLDIRDSEVAARQVLAVAARRDADLTKQLNQKLVEAREKENRNSSASVQSALDLLETDPKAAAMLAESGAPAGLASDAAGYFILQLAEIDPLAAEKVYRAYLDKVAANPNLQLGHLLWLAGYPMGYGETYGFLDRNSLQMVGGGGRYISTLAPNAELARKFLDIALISAQQTLQRAATAPNPQSDTLNGLVLFTTTYLSAEVARFRPQRVGEWNQLYTQSLGGASSNVQSQVSDSFQQVLSNRAVAEKRRQSPESTPLDYVQDMLDKAPKMTTECERNRTYAQAALTFSYAKDQQRALATAGEIKDIALRTDVTQFIYYDMSSAAISSGDQGRAQEYARHVEDKSQRALLQVKIATLALSKKDRVLVLQLLTETQKLSHSISDPISRAAALLASPYLLAQFDTCSAGETVREAIKAVNLSEDINLNGFSVLRKVNLMCMGETQDRWFGGRDQTERFSLFEILATLSKSDMDGAILTAQEIERVPIRIRAMVAIVKANIKKA